MTPAPAYAYDYADLHHAVVQALADREAAYPDRVAHQKMTADEAAKGIRVMRSVVADWQRILDLRAGRAPLALDATATDYEKREAITYMHWRSQTLLAKIVAPLRAQLDDIGALSDIDGDIIGREVLDQVSRARLRGWPHHEISIFLVAERHTWLTEALLWHAERWPLAMLYAELQAELVDSDRVAANVAVAA